MSIPKIDFEVEDLNVDDLICISDSDLGKYIDKVYEAGKSEADKQAANKSCTNCIELKFETHDPEEDRGNYYCLKHPIICTSTITTCPIRGLELLSKIKCNDWEEE